MAMELAVARPDEVESQSVATDTATTQTRCIALIEFNSSEVPSTGSGRYLLGHKPNIMKLTKQTMPPAKPPGNCRQ